MGKETYMLSMKSGTVGKFGKICGLVQAMIDGGNSESLIMDGLNEDYAGTDIGITPVTLAITN